MKVHFRKAKRKTQIYDAKRAKKIDNKMKMTRYGPK